MGYIADRATCRARIIAADSTAGDHALGGLARSGSTRIASSRRTDRREADERRDHGIAAHPLLGVLASIGHEMHKADPQDAAIDGTGLETTCASAHFVSRAGRKRTRFVKVLIGVLCASVCPIALVVDWGPSHDMKQAWALREKMMATCRPTMLWGDGAFDCEAWHRANWDGWSVPSYAPTTVKSADGRVNGFYRHAFQIPVAEYGRRWMSEVSIRSTASAAAMSRSFCSAFFSRAASFLSGARSPGCRSVMCIDASLRRGIMPRVQKHHPTIGSMAQCPACAERAQEGTGIRMT